MSVGVKGGESLRASEIARRRAEEERAEAFFLCERRRSRRIPSAMREQAQKVRKPVVTAAGVNGGVGRMRERNGRLGDHAQ
jgi:hypothetical protein